ncbi:hypothetical protein C8Q70DRAFT_398248 [Cubamyces menziesii]|nr:hypothetical protein C8Q70DRAFT_398248 [Cubamyces menziesii]
MSKYHVYSPMTPRRFIVRLQQQTPTTCDIHILFKPRRRDTATTLPLLPSLDNTLGAIFLGVVFGAMLYGVTINQAYRYYSMYYSADKLYVKALVTAIVFLETLHTAAWVFSGYHELVSEAFNPSGILKFHWVARSTFILTSFAIIACQTFYCCRIFLLGSRHRWLLIPAAASMLTGLAFGTAAGVVAFVEVPKITDLHRIRWMISVAYGLAVLSDVLFTGILILILHRSRTHCKRSDAIIDVLMIYTMYTGLLTSIASCLALVFILIIPGNLIYVAMSIVGAKFYANSVLALLNSRRSIDSRFIDDFDSFDCAQRHSEVNILGRLRMRAGQLVALSKHVRWARAHTPRRVSIEEIVFAVPTETSESATGGVAGV